MKQVKNENGFTLIEAIISIAVLGVGIIGLYSLQMAGVTGNSDANNRTRATSVAADVIEQLAQTAYSDSVFDEASNPHDQTALTSPVITLPDGIVSVVWSVTDWSSDGVDNNNDGVDDDPDESGMKHLDITVNYRVGQVVKQIDVSYMKVALM